MQVPIGAEEGFEGVVDLLKMKAIHWDTASQGTTFEYREIPAELQDKAVAARAFMVEAAAEASEELMDKYLNEGELSEAEIIAGLRAAHPEGRDRSRCSAAARSRTRACRPCSTA